MGDGMMRRTALRGLTMAGAGLTLGMPAASRAPAWPSKPIRIIVGFPPGGLTDALARTFGEQVSRVLGQSVIVDNRAGAGGNIAAEIVAKAAPDGHTFLHTIQGTLVQHQALYSKLPFDPDKDFTLVSCINSGPLPMVVHKSLPVTNLDTLKSYAKANKVNFGSWAPGSSAHIICNQLNKLWGTSMEIVHYRGEAPMWQDMLAGSLQVAMGSYQAMNPHVQSGAVRPIAMPGPGRTPKFPDLKTFPEQGIDHAAFKLSGWIGLIGPANLPQAITDRLAGLWIQAAATAEAKKVLDTFGLTDPPVGPATFTKLYKEEGPHWISLVRETGAKIE